MICLLCAAPTGGKKAVSEDNKALARRFLEAQARGDMETLDALMAPDFVDRSLLPGQRSGREDYKQSIADMLAVFSNTSFTLEAQVAEGDHVVSRFTGTSIHRGEFLGVDPTGQETSYSGIHIHRIADGKIVAEWSESDNLEVVQPAFEQEMRRRKRIEQEKMAALGKLSAGLAHELGDGESIKGVLEWLEATLESTDLSDEVGRSVGRISELVRAMKVYTAMDQAAYAETDV